MHYGLALTKSIADSYEAKAGIKVWYYRFSN